MISGFFRLFCVAACLAAPMAAPLAGARAQDASERARGPKSFARLILGSQIAPGSFRAGVEIELAPGARTYWRNPGEAGIPPTFAFTKSDNLADAAVAWPAPRRYVEAGSDIFGYGERVVFPLTLRARDPARPVTLRLSLDYGVCETICIPVHAELELELRPNAAATAFVARVEKAFARVPRPAPPGAEGPLAILSVEPVAGAAKPEFLVRVRAPREADLFGEAPDLYFLETGPAAGERAFRLVVAERPKDAAPAIDARLTLVSGGEAIETTVRLDLAAGRP